MDIEHVMGRLLLKVVLSPCAMAHAKPVTEGPRWHSRSLS